MLSKIVTATVLVAGIALIGNAQTAHAESQPNTNNPAQVQTQPKQEKKVVVQPGDILSRIATDNQTTYVRLFDANEQIQNPDVIHPGWEIRIPDPSEQIPSRQPVSAPAVAPVTQTPARPATARKQSSAAVATPAANVSGDVWDRLAACEAGGNWSINTGNGYYGGLQFSLGSWRAVGGSGYPHQASKSEQIARGQMLQARQGWGAWPACSAKLGLR